MNSISIQLFGNMFRYHTSIIRLVINTYLYPTCTFLKAHVSRRHKLFEQIYCTRQVIVPLNFTTQLRWTFNTYRHVDNQHSYTNKQENMTISIKTDKGHKTSLMEEFELYEHCRREYINILSYLNLNFNCICNLLFEYCKTKLTSK